ncbi:hypothetical protein G9A89_012373 [Geosiphon pyriformis]|nr:hypothetical protein G9A89_012373 [Geosiphon pyriformis]
MSLVSKGKPSISKRQSNYDKPAARSFSTPQDKKRAKYDTDTEHNLLLISSQLKPFRKELPIWKEREILLENIKNAATIVITGEMGSGKSTQIPQFIMEAGLSLDGSIAITQPRRVAAISLAKRVAQEVGTQIGQRVGYSVRFDDFTSRNTIIKYLTDGMLLRESLTDPLLKGYQVVILDEAHERTLRTDILFGMLKRAQKTRAQMVLDGEKVNNLKIIIMSATLDANKFANYFKSSTILTIPGRQFPVTLHYALESQPDYLDAALVTVFQIHTEQPLGDILVFLPGNEILMFEPFNRALKVPCLILILIIGQEDIETLEKLIIDYGATLAPDKQKLFPLSNKPRFSIPHLGGPEK